MSIRRGAILASAISTLLMIGCNTGPTAVSFSKDVKPLIDKYCTDCHTRDGAGAQASGFVTENYTAIMQGTRFGPVVVANDPLSSSLFRLVAGKVDPSIKMPHGEAALSQEEILSIEQWIEQGAKDD